MHNLEIYQHVKTGGLYFILHDNAKIEKTLEDAVVYTDTLHQHIWIRPKSEFFDGRFVKVD